MQKRKSVCTYVTFYTDNLTKVCIKQHAGEKFNMQKSSLCNLTENQVKGVKIWRHMQKGRDFITLQIFQALYFHQKIDWLRICILDSKFYHANKRLSELA